MTIRNNGAKAMPLDTPPSIRDANRFADGGRAALRVTRVVFDGEERPDGAIPLIDDHREHNVDVELG